MLSRPNIKVTMLKTRRGQFDAFSPFCFYEGRTYMVPQSLARRYIENGVAINFVTDSQHNLSEKVKKNPSVKKKSKESG